MADTTIPTHIMSLDDLGDVEAPKGSQPWARAIRYELYRLARQSTASVRDFQTYLKLLEEYKGYQQLEDDEGKPFRSISAFAVAKIPFGLGYDPDIILHLQKETREMLLREKIDELVSQATGSGPKGGRPRKTCESHVSTRRERAAQNGVSEWTQSHIDYLAGHRKDLLHEVRIHAMSLDKAYRLAKGEVDETPFDVLLRAWRRISREDRVRFIREMLTEAERAELADELLAIETRTT